VGWDQNSAGIVDDSPVLGALVTIGVLPSSVATNPSGPLGGVQAGYNYQINKMVYGVEADLSIASIDGSNSIVTRGLVPIATYTTTVDQRLNWFSTLRGRVGFIEMDHLLFYGAGGLAVVQSDYSANIHRAAILLNFDVPASTSVTKVGWTIGAGVEYALDNKWSAKAEYLYYDLDNESITGNLTIAGIPTPPQATYNFVTRGSIVRFGLNFKIQ
jgi:outer membrane immunogenic protein